MSKYVRSGVAAVVVALFLAAGAVAQQAANPVITSIDPETIVEDASTFTLTVNGTGFVQNRTTVRFGGVNKTTTFVSTTRVTVQVTAGEVTTSGSKTVQVVVDGRTSNTATFTILPNNPIIESISPDTVPVGNGEFTLRVNGQNFAQSARVAVNGSVRDTTWINAQTLDARMLPADTATGSTRTITVQNPNRTSAGVPLTITSGSLRPEITGISPANAVAGGPAFTLTITGRNFERTSVVRFGTTQKTATFVDSTRLTVQVLQTEIARAGTISITVSNGALTSTPVTLTIDAEPLPTITRVTPESLTVDTRSLTITVDGTNFKNGAEVRVGGSRRNTTFVSSTRLTAALLTADVDQPGELSITVKNPTTEGRESAAKIIFVIAANAPVLNSISPTVITIGTLDARLIVSGTNLQQSDVVMFDGVPRETQFVNSTQLNASLLDTDVATQHDIQVTIRRGTTGTTSAPQTLRIISASTPFIDSLQPAVATAGTPGFALLVNGRNFAPDSTVFVDDRPATTRYVSATQLSADVVAGDIASPRTLEITVRNSNGATSAIFNLPVILIVPEIVTIDPVSVPAGDPGFSLTVTGNNFSSTALINLNGVPQSATRFLSNGSLSLIIPSSVVATPGAVVVTVTDRGVTSDPVSLQVLRPNVTLVDPSVIAAGSGDTTVTVTGTSFLPSSRVSFKGGERPTTYVSPTQLTAVLPASALAELGEVALVVVNTPEAISTPFFVQIVSPGAPRIDFVSPGTALAGTTSVTIRVLGVNFLPTARIHVNGQERTTVFVSTNELTTVLTADDLRNPGTLSITVRSAEGQTSPVATFGVITGGPAPARRRSARH